MSFTNRVYELAKDAFDSNEEQIMLQIAKSWPEEYKKAVAIMLREDAEADATGVPNLSMICEAIPKALEDKFLSDLARFIREL